LQLLDPIIADAKYELVALYPRHLLPNGKILVADTGENEPKAYVPALDNTLRQTAEVTSPRFPPFSSDYPRQDKDKLNPFLVILNAEIKFRRYRRRMVPSPLPLPQDVTTLMDKNIELVKLIYWNPVLQPGTKGAEILGLTSASVPESGLQHAAGPSNEELGFIEGEEVQTVRPTNYGAIRRPAADASLEEMMAYSQSVLTDRG
jgi:hypothetical protein